MARTNRLTRSLLAFVLLGALVVGIALSVRPSTRGAIFVSAFDPTIALVHTPTGATSVEDLAVPGPSTGSASDRAALVARSGTRSCVVENGTSTPVVDATVVCVDALGRRTALAVVEGAFEPIGEAPFALEIAAPSHATRWVLLRDAAAVDIDLWRAGRIEVTWRDEGGQSLRNGRFVVRPPLSKPTVLAVTSSLFAVNTLDSKRAAAVLSMSRYDDQGRANESRPRSPSMVGPTSQQMTLVTKSDGIAVLDGVPRVDGYRVIAYRLESIASVPNGALVAESQGATFETGAGHFDDDGVAHFEIVRRGSGSLSFELEHEADSKRGGASDMPRIELFRAIEPSEESPDVAWKRTSGWSISPVRGEYSRVIQALVPGEYIATALWETDRTAQDVDAARWTYCFAEKRFLIEPESHVDLGTIGPDPGSIELEFRLVDELGLPIAVALAFPSVDLPIPGDEIHRASAAPWLDGTFTCRGTCADIELEIDALRLIDASNPNVVLLGMPLGRRLFSIRPNIENEQYLTDWNFAGPIALDLEESRFVARHVAVPVAMTRPAEIHVACPPSTGASISRSFGLELSLRRVQTGAVVSVPLELAATESGNALTAKATLATGTWRVASSVTLASSYRVEPGMMYCFGSPPIEPKTAEWLVVLGTIEISTSGLNRHQLAAVRAATLDIGRGTNDLHRLGKALGIEDRIAPQIEWDGEWIPFDLGDDMALDLTDADTLTVRGLPPNSRVRFGARALEFATGPAGSTVAAVAPELR